MKNLIISLWVSIILHGSQVIGADSDDSWQRIDHSANRSYVTDFSGMQYDPYAPYPFSPFFNPHHYIFPFPPIPLIYPGDPHPQYPGYFYAETEDDGSDSENSVIEHDQGPDLPQALDLPLAPTALPLLSFIGESFNGHMAWAQPLNADNYIAF